MLKNPGISSGLVPHEIQAVASHVVSLKAANLFFSLQRTTSSTRVQRIAYHESTLEFLFVSTRPNLLSCPPRHDAQWGPKWAGSLFGALLALSSSSRAAHPCVAASSRLFPCPRICLPRVSQPPLFGLPLFPHFSFPYVGSLNVSFFSRSLFLVSSHSVACARVSFFSNVNRFPPLWPPRSVPSRPFAYESDGGEIRNNLNNQPLENSPGRPNTPNKSYR